MADEIITLWRYRDLPEALVSRAKLEANGIECFLADENVIRLDWFWSNAFGRMRLQLLEGDAQTALDILGEEIPSSFSAEEVGGEFIQPRCPNCQSLDVSFEEYRKASLAIFWLLSLPLPIYKNRWHCEDCRYEWREKDVSSF